MNYIFIYKKIIISILPVFVLLSCSKIENTKSKIQQDSVEINRDTIRNEMQSTLNKILELWYPLSLDTVYGGFFSDINYKWELQGIQNKMIVTQARHVWAASNAYKFYRQDMLLKKVATHGVKFLKEVMWDKDFGGFYDMVSRNGNPIKESGKIIKRVYGNAFAIYGLTEYYKAFNDTSALNLAIKTFNWMEKHSYDPEYGGYFQFLSRDGTPFMEGYRNTPPKDQNSSIHILECFTELYSVWPNSLLKDRLNSLFHIIRDTIVGEKGYLTLYFKRNWTPISFRNSDSSLQRKNIMLDHISFGHDVETAYLLFEASKVLGIKHDTTTLRIAKKMDDNSLKNGWDNEYGGIYDGGYYYDDENQITIVLNTKEWWSQAEAFHSFLLMSELFPNDNINYYEKFCLQWDYCKKYVIDQKYGDWYRDGIEREPDFKFAPKGTIWKGNYHTTRALINCIRMLNKN
jgi:mannobiose 2-epimerase